jgi:L-amino acid N-acyltransferase YncA
MGFEQTGVSPRVGFKFGRWVDVVWMQRSLNAGDEAIPLGSGLQF